MTSPIQTIEGHATPSPEDREYMDYLDELIDIPSSMPSYGLLLFKGDPVAFRLGCEEWISSR